VIFCHFVIFYIFALKNRILVMTNGVLFCQDFVRFCHGFVRNMFLDPGINPAILTKRGLKMTFCQGFVRLCQGFVSHRTQ